jgi:hypothetical protein
MKELFVLWLVAAMNMVAPAHRQHFIREAQESYAQADARYKEIASAIITVAFDPSETPIFRGQNGRSKTALFIMHKFYMESGFRRDVQLGTGRERLSAQGYNDYGRSWCMGQIMLGSKKVQDGPGRWTTTSAYVTQEGWTGPELLADNEKCVRATASIMRRSISACSKLPFSDRLAAYAAGTCESEKGQIISRTRYSSFSRLWNRAWPNHPQVPDEKINDPSPAVVAAPEAKL